MENVKPDEMVVVCSKCGIKNTFKEPLKRNQVIICHGCRQKQQLRTYMGKLKAFPLVDIYSMHKGEEQK